MLMTPFGSFGPYEVETRGVQMMKFDVDCGVVVPSGIRGCENGDGNCDSCMDLQEYMLVSEDD